MLNSVKVKNNIIVLLSTGFVFAFSFKRKKAFFLIFLFIYAIDIMLVVL